MNILLTGSHGFIGSLLKKKLASNSHQIFEFDSDITNNEAIKSHVTKKKWDAIIHLAAQSHPSNFKKEIEHSYYINTISTIKLYQEVLQHNPETLFIFPSTAHLYNTSQLECDELHISEDHNIFPYNDYANSKYIAENTLISLAKNFNSNLCILRIFNHVHKSQPSTYFMASVYNQLLEAKKNQTKAQIKVGNINITRDISPVQNAINAIVFLIESKELLNEGVNIFNVCSGKGKILKEIIHNLARKMDVDYETIIQQENIRNDEPQSLIGSKTKLQNLGWTSSQGQDIESLIELFLEDI